MDRAQAELCPEHSPIHCDYTEIFITMTMLALALAVAFAALALLLLHLLMLMLLLVSSTSSSSFFPSNPTTKPKSPTPQTPNRHRLEPQILKPMEIVQFLLSLICSTASAGPAKRQELFRYLCSRLLMCLYCHHCFFALHHSRCAFVTA